MEKIGALPTAESGEPPVPLTVDDALTIEALRSNGQLASMWLEQAVRNELGLVDTPQTSICMVRKMRLVNLNSI